MKIEINVPIDEDDGVTTLVAFKEMRSVIQAGRQRLVAVVNAPIARGDKRLHRIAEAINDQLEDAFQALTEEIERREQETGQEQVVRGNGGK